VKLYTAKQSLAIECHTIQLPQLRDCMTYSAFRCTIGLSYVKFTLTSRDLFIHRPYAEVFTYIFYVSLDRPPNVFFFKKALLRPNCKECLITELVAHASPIK